MRFEGEPDPEPRAAEKEPRTGDMESGADTGTAGFRTTVQDPGRYLPRARSSRAGSAGQDRPAGGRGEQHEPDEGTAPERGGQAGQPARKRRKSGGDDWV